jgi:hypothetical protein
MGTLSSGSVKVLVPKRDGSLIKLSLQTPVTKLDVRGTAFTVTSCESDKGFVDVISVTEGTVHAEYSGGTTAVNAGDSFTFCTSCADGPTPLCGAAGDAGAQPPPDATVSTTDAVAPTADMGMTVKPDTGSMMSPPDAGMMMMPPPDAGSMMMPPPDAGMMSPPDATVPPPDAAVMADLAALTPDMMVAPPPDAVPPSPDMMVMPDPDAAPPPPDMMAMPPPDAAPPPPDMMAMPPPDAAPPPDAPPDTGFTPVDAVVALDDAGSASLMISPPSADYGTVEVNTASPVFDFTVTNPGDTASGTPTVAVPSDFFVESSTCSAPLAPQASCVVRVKMIPGQTGPTSGALVISASPGGSTSAGLSGFGADPAKLDIMPALQSMGNVAPGLTGAPVSFTIKNIGGVKSGIPNFFFQPTNAPFTVTQNFCTAELDSGGTCQVWVTFTAPGTFGQSAGQLFASATPGGNTVANLTGNSTYVEITPTSMNFGSIMKLSVGPGGSDFTVWHLGQSGAPMLLIMSAISGANPGDFVITGTTCTNGLTPGGSCTVTVDFTPTGTGLRTAQLDVAAHLATGTPQGTDKAALSGNGV